MTVPTYDEAFRLRAGRPEDREAIKKGEAVRAARRRKPMGPIPADVKHAAILAFSRHEIDRAELMARITPR